MADLEQLIGTLRDLFDNELAARRKRQENFNSQRSPALKDEFDKNIMQDIGNWERLIMKEVGDVIRYPSYHNRHKHKLEEFHLGGSYEKSVFIMTKFPEGKSPADVQLKKIIEVVKEVITECDYFPRIASDRNFHPILWDNVELYLIGCAKGIAIVEDRYKAELNPNVAIEWGWMRGLGKDVLYLQEQSFLHGRADWGGFINDSFSWDEPEPGIRAAIKKWLQ